MGWARRVVQGSAIALLLALPLLSRGSALYQAHGKGASHVGELAGPWEAFLFEAFSQTLGRLEDGVRLADGFQGGFWSITLFGVTFSDPLAFVGHLAARGEAHWPLAAGTLLALVLAAVAGRFFCGWLCPVNTLLELNARLRAWIERRVVLGRLGTFVAPARARHAVLAGTLLFSVGAGVNLFAFVLPYAGLARDWHFFVFGGALGFGILFLLVIALAELFAAPRLWCRGLCPTGLVLAWFGRRRLAGIRRRAEGACPTGCGACITVCPVGANPRDGVATDECLMCNECADICPPGILRLGRSERPAQGRARVPAGMLAVLLCVALPISGALAHHIKGLPHYGYLENYPQTPTRELQIEAPPYDLILVAYAMDGLRRGRSDTPDDVMVFLSVTDTRTGKAHTGRVTMDFRPVGGGPSIRRRFDAPLEETVYRMRVALPGPVHAVDIHIGGAGGVLARTRLELDGDGNESVLIAVLGIVGLAALAVLLMALRRRRARANRIV